MSLQPNDVDTEKQKSSFELNFCHSMAAREAAVLMPVTKNYQCDDISVSVAYTVKPLI